MMRFEKEEVLRYLIDNIPMILDLENQELKYDTRHINYKIYRYIRELQEELKDVKTKNEKN